MRLAQVRVTALSVVGGCLLSLGALAGTAQAGVLSPGAAATSPRTSPSASATPVPTCQVFRLPAHPPQARRRPPQAPRRPPRARRRHQFSTETGLRHRNFVKVADAHAIYRCLFDLARAYHEPEQRPEEYPANTHAVSLSLNVDLADSVACITLKVVRLTIGVPHLRLCRRLRFGRCSPYREPQPEHQHQCEHQCQHQPEHQHQREPQPEHQRQPKHQHPPPARAPAPAPARPAHLPSPNCA